MIDPERYPVEGASGSPTLDEVLKEIRRKLTRDWTAISESYESAGAHIAHELRVDVICRQIGVMTPLQFEAEQARLGYPSHLRFRDA